MEEKTNQEAESSVDVVHDEEILKSYGVLRVPLPSELDCAYWSQTLSQVTPMIMAAEGDGDYAFYRNILEEPDFPFDSLLQYFTPWLYKYFIGVVNECCESGGGGERNHLYCNQESAEITDATILPRIYDAIRLDDAFCVHYNMSQQDTSGAKHTDPSDITINMCLETSPELEGSQVQFYGTESLLDPTTTSSTTTNTAASSTDDDTTKESSNVLLSNSRNPIPNNAPSRFLVSQKKGYATLHWGHHLHETLPLLAGERTNIILTYCFKDPEKSQAANRSCYFPPAS